MCKLRIQPLRRPQGQKTTKWLNIPKLNNASIVEEFARDLSARLSGAPQDDQGSIEGQWETFIDATYSTAFEHLGLANHKHPDWFDENDEEIQALLSEKHQLFRAHQNDPTSQAKKGGFSNAKRKAQKKTKKQEMQDLSYSKKADEIQGYADSHDTKRFYDALKTVYGPQSSGSSPLLTADGMQLLTEKKHILEMWADHFNQVLNRSAEKAIASLPQVETNRDLDPPPLPPPPLTKMKSEILSSKFPVTKCQDQMLSPQKYTKQQGRH